MKRRYVKIIDAFGAVITLVAIHEGIAHFVLNGCLDEPGILEAHGDVITAPNGMSATEYLYSQDFCKRMARYGISTLRRESNQQIL